MLKKKKVLATIYYGKESLVIEILKNSFDLLLQFLLLSKTLKSRPNPHQNRGTGTDKQTQEAEGRKRPKNYRFVFVRAFLLGITLFQKVHNHFSLYNSQGNSRLPLFRSRFVVWYVLYSNIVILISNKLVKWLNHERTIPYFHLFRNGIHFKFKIQINSTILVI